MNETVVKILQLMTDTIDQVLKAGDMGTMAIVINTRPNLWSSITLVPYDSRRIVEYERNPVTYEWKLKPEPQIFEEKLDHLTDPDEDDPEEDDLK